MAQITGFGATIDPRTPLYQLRRQALWQLMKKHKVEGASENMPADTMRLLLMNKLGSDHPDYHPGRTNGAAATQETPVTGYVPASEHEALLRRMAEMERRMASVSSAPPGIGLEDPAAPAFVMTVDPQGLNPFQLRGRLRRHGIMDVPPAATKVELLEMVRKHEEGQG